MFILELIKFLILMINIIITKTKFQFKHHSFIIIKSIWKKFNYKLNIMNHIFILYKFWVIKLKWLGDVMTIIKWIRNLIEIISKLKAKILI
jgi:hypothetical protein